MFFVPYKSNEPQLEYLLAFVGRHKEEILNQRMFLIVNGYCNSLPTHKANLATAKLRSNRVKSELIVRRDLRKIALSPEIMPNAANMSPSLYT